MEEQQDYDGTLFKLAVQTAKKTMKIRMAVTCEFT